MQRKHRGKLTPLAADLKSVLRKFTRGQAGVHPEIWARWHDIVGHDLARRVIPRRLEGRTLIVAVSSASWMQELTYLIPRLLDRFADEVGEGVVKEIRLVLASSPDAGRGEAGKKG